MVGSFYTSRNRLTLTTGKAAKCNRMTYNPGTQHAKHANDYMGYYAALTTISGIYQAQYFRRSNMCRTKTATLYQVRLCTVCTAVCTVQVRTHPTAPTVAAAVGFFVWPMP